MMPERMAKTDPYQQITDTLGSGPFKFVREEFEPGHKKRPSSTPAAAGDPEARGGGKPLL